MTGSDWQELDARDPLAAARDGFLLPEDCVYLNGNSLGPLSQASAARVEAVVHEQWGKDLVTSWNRHAWIDLPLACGNKIAALLGAAPGQVVCCDSVSVNLFKLLAAGLGLRPGRNRILSTNDNFPTDLYTVQGLAALLGEQRCELVTCTEEEIPAFLDDRVAVLLLTQVNFRSGALLDMERLTRLAHEQGIITIWDLAHSAGVVPLQLDAWQVDFAVGCGYKYLNGGPGAPAFIYAAQRHHNALVQPLQGWMGHQAPFEFSPEYEPASGIASFLTGTPPILSMAALDAALDSFAGVTAGQLWDKASRLAELFQAAVAARPALAELQLRSPDQPAQRGAQLSYAHDQAYGLCQALAEVGVLADFRAPDLLRLGFSPLILRYADVARAVVLLEQCVSEQRYRQARFARRQKVT